MAYKDIHRFMAKLERNKQLKRIRMPVNPYLEITEIADRVVKAGGPALLFERVNGSAYPLLIGAFATERRMAMALSVDSLDDIGRGIANLLDLGNYMSVGGVLKSSPRLARLLSVFTIDVKQAACQEVAEDPDLNTLPILHCWPGDAGRFITLPLVFTKDPETGRQNIGMYRMQVYSPTETGMHWHLHKDGRAIYEKYRKRGGRMPVSVVVGCDPAVIYAATAPLPPLIDELMFAGYLRKAPVPVTKCLTNDIKVPANSEFVLEGYVDVDAPLREEGPFGDHTGYYSEKDNYPVFHVSQITRKKEPVFMATIVGRPPMEDCFMGKATERIFLPLLQLLAPEIVDVNFPLEGVFHGCVIVSIDKQYPSQAKKVMSCLWGIGQMMYTKMIVVVDKDVDPHDLSTVAWKVFNNIDAGRDLVISEGPLDALDHASPLRHTGNRLGIDATRKWKSEGFARDWPEDIIMTEEIKRRVDKKWKSLRLD